MSDLPFEPLFAPRIVTTEKPVPVSWFERIAPQIAPVVPLERMRHDDAKPHADGSKTAAFPTIEQVTAEERRMRLGGDIIPPEVIVMRQEAHAEAQLLINEALGQSRQITQEAEKAGYAAGYEKGHAEGVHRADTAESISRPKIIRTRFAEPICSSSFR